MSNRLSEIQSNLDRIQTRISKACVPWEEIFRKSP